MTTIAHRLLLCAAALGCVAARARGRGAVMQGAVLASLLVLAAIAFTADAPTFWPLAVAIAILPWLPVPGAPDFPWALRLAVSLLATTVIVHAVFFGEDRYHVVVTPVLAILAAAALRPSGRPGGAARPASGVARATASAARGA